MAVVEKSSEVDLIFKVQTGENSDGDPTTSSRTIGNVNPDASAEDMYTVASGIAGLQTYPVLEIRRRVDTVLEEQA